MALPMSPRQIFIVFLIIIFLVIIVVVVVFQRVVLGVSFLVFGVIIAKAPQCFFHSKKLSLISEREQAVSIRSRSEYSAYGKRLVCIIISD